MKRILLVVMGTAVTLNVCLTSVYGANFQPQDDYSSVLILPESVSSQVREQITVYLRQAYGGQLQHWTGETDGATQYIYVYPYLGEIEKADVLAFIYESVREDRTHTTHCTSLHNWSHWTGAVFTTCGVEGETVRLPNLYSFDNKPSALDATTSSVTVSLYDFPDTQAELTTLNASACCFPSEFNDSASSVRVRF